MITIDMDNNLIRVKAYTETSSYYLVDQKAEGKAYRIYRCDFSDAGHQVVFTKVWKMSFDRAKQQALFMALIEVARLLEPERQRNEVNDLAFTIQPY